MQHMAAIRRRRDDGRPPGSPRRNAESAERSAALSRDARVGSPPSSAAASVDDPAPSRRTVRRALSSRSSLRRAILLQEILGVPKALQPPAGGSSGRSVARALDENGHHPDRAGEVAGYVDPTTRGVGHRAGVAESLGVPAEPARRAPWSVRSYRSIGHAVTGARAASASAIRRLLGLVQGRA